MPQYKIVYPDLLEFFRRTEAFHLNSVNASLFDGQDIKSTIASSLYEDKTYRPNKSIYLHIPEKHFPHIIEAFVRDREVFINQRVIEAYNFILNSFNDNVLFMPPETRTLRYMQSLSDRENKELIRNIFQPHLLDTTHTLPFMHGQEYASSLVDLFIDCFIHLYERADSFIPIFNLVSQRLPSFLESKIHDVEMNVRLNSPFNRTHGTLASMQFTARQLSHDYTLVGFQNEVYIRLSPVHLGKRYYVENLLFSPFIKSPF